MIYNLISSDLIKEITFISVLFAFILTCAAIALGKNILPRDAGRAYACLLYTSDAADDRAV